MGQFTGCLPPHTVNCDEPGCKDYAALIHFGRPLCWDHSSLESGRMREEPKHDGKDVRPAVA
jgi:hypothetical protein